MKNKVAEIHRRCGVALLVLAIVLVGWSPAVAQSKSVAVRGYYRKNGTYVRPHMRSAPSASFRALPPMPYYPAAPTPIQQRTGSLGDSGLSPKARTEARTSAKTTPRVRARAPRPPYEMRDWHDIDGELIGRARMAWQAMSLLRLELEDGEALEVDTEDLSKADLDWLETAHRSPDLVRERVNASTAAE
jgi:hypothetical protein